MVAFITGVGSGIGRATCMEFLKNGHHVVGVLRKVEQEKSIRAEAESLPGEFTCMHLDLTDHKSVDHVSTQLEYCKVDQIDVVINLAGTLGMMEMSSMDRAHINEVMDINFVTPLLLIQHLQPYIPRNGNIINVTSMSGFQDSVRFPGLSVYGASKAALASVTQSLAVELDEVGIRINALAIGAVNTAMLQNAFPDFKAQIEASDMASYIYSFATHGHKFYQGKVLPVAVTNP